ncbi:hypothetical protein ACVCAH_35780 [Micromonospora sp. LZ34]
MSDDRWNRRRSRTCPATQIWFNGHEWAKRQATKAGISFRELSNGFAVSDDPTGLQGICDRLGPGTITVFTERWCARLPLPFTTRDRAAGYWWDSSMRQIEVAKTIVFTAPRHARGFFEALTRTTSTSAAPTTWRSSSTGRSAPPPKACSAPPSTVTTTPSWSTPSTGTRGSSTTSKTSERYADETVINDTYDIGVLRRLEHLNEVVAKAGDANRRLLDTIRAGQSCVLANPVIERIAQPTLFEDGRRP